jgi:hypothetical protein
VAYLEHKKKLDLIDRGLWKPEKKQEKPEHKLITGLFFFLLGVALLIGSYFVELDLVSGLRISGLLTTAAGVALMIAYTIGKKGAYVHLTRIIGNSFMRPKFSWSVSIQT